MHDLSQAETDHYLRLKAEERNHWGSAFEQAAWFHGFKRKNPECLHPHLLILDSPLGSANAVRDSANLSELPSVEQATLDGDDGEARENSIQVCLLDESSHKAVKRWVSGNQMCDWKYIWVHLQGERRLAMKLFPVKWDDMACEDCEARFQ